MSDNRLRLFQASVFDLLSGLADGSIDCVITDPPYESLEKHRAKGTTTRLKVSEGSSNEWFPVIPNACFPQLFAELYRVLAKNGHLYVYCDAETMFEAKPVAEAAGFKFWKPLVWDKATIAWDCRPASRSACASPGSGTATQRRSRWP